MDKSVYFLYLHKKHLQLYKTRTATNSRSKKEEQTIGMLKRIYSILIVSANDNFTLTLTDLLSESRYTPLSTVHSINAAKEILAEHPYDFVILNSPLPDNASIHFAMDTCSKKQTVVLLIVKSEVHAAIHDKVAAYGVFTLSTPLPKPTLAQVFCWMESARERLRQIEQKTISVEEKVAELRLTNHAKWILINELQMNESDAHRYLEKQAMDRCLPKREIAQSLISTYGGRS